MKWKTQLVTLLVLLVGGTLFSSSPAEAQLLTVTGDYRVVELDKDNQRVGVSLPEASPGKRQNWVYLRATTDIVRRQENEEGWFKEDRLTFDSFFETAKPGDILKVHGGRRWDKGITAKRIRM